MKDPLPLRKQFPEGKLNKAGADAEDPRTNADMKQTRGQFVNGSRSEMRR